jgi:chromate transporter
MLVTWFTFLPSFVFILAGGPWVERTRGSLRLGAPMTAVTAAVVGVIASLALFFATHVLWPDGLRSPPDTAAMALTGVALVALFVARLGVMTVIGACAAVGAVFARTATGT